MIRPATPADVPEILTMIAELAAYEKEPDAAVATAEQLHAALFGPAPAVFALIAAEPGPDGAETVVGMAVYFRTFSTWTGTHGIWLEDLYVRPGVRGGGHGKQLLATLGHEGLEGQGRDILVDADNGFEGSARRRVTPPSTDRHCRHTSLDALTP